MKVVTSRTSDQGSGSLGAVHLFAPLVFAAYGMPLKV